MIARVGILGDIHGQVKPLEISLGFLREQSPDSILCTGDLPVKNGERSVNTAEIMNRCATLLLEQGVYTVRGNHDRYFVEHAADSLLADLFPEEWEASRKSLEFARSLPVTREFETPRGKLLLCHGVGANDTAGIYPGGDAAFVAEGLQGHGITREKVAVLILGHMHQRMMRTVADIILINPGTMLHEKESPGFALADFVAGTVQFYTIRSGRVIVDALYPIGD